LKILKLLNCYIYSELNIALLKLLTNLEEVSLGTDKDLSEGYGIDFLN